MVSITGRASLFFEFFFCMYVNRKEQEDGKTEQQLQSYQFTQGYITLHRLQVHHLTLTFIIHNQYYVNTLFIYIHTYIYYIINCSFHNASIKKYKVYVFRLVHIKNKTLGRARDPRANGAWLNKLTE